MQDPNPTRHLHLRLYLHCRPDPIPTATLYGSHCAHRLWGHQRERLNSKSGRHVLGPTRVDGTGGYEHEPDPGTRIEELECAVVVSEGGFVWVPNGDVLGESEVNGGGVVRDGEGREVDGVNGDFGVVGFEDSEVNDEDDDDNEDEEDCGDYARS